MQMCAEKNFERREHCRSLRHQLCSVTPFQHPRAQFKKLTRKTLLWRKNCSSLYLTECITRIITVDLLEEVDASSDGNTVVIYKKMSLDGHNYTVSDIWIQLAMTRRNQTWWRHKDCRGTQIVYVERCTNIRTASDHRERSLQTVQRCKRSNRTGHCTRRLMYLTLSLAEPYARAFV